MAKWLVLMTPVSRKNKWALFVLRSAISLFFRWNNALLLLEGGRCILQRGCNVQGQGGLF